MKRNLWLLAIPVILIILIIFSAGELHQSHMKTEISVSKKQVSSHRQSQKQKQSKRQAARKASLKQSSVAKNASRANSSSSSNSDGQTTANPQDSSTWNLPYEGYPTYRDFLKKNQENLQKQNNPNR